MTKEDESYRRYVRGQLQMARLRAQLLIKEIDTIIAVLRSNAIEPDEALLWMSQDALALVQSEPAETVKYDAGFDVGDSERDQRCAVAD